MCGIVGIVNFDGSPVEPEVLSEMRDVLTHRGPDDYGYAFLSTKLMEEMVKNREFETASDSKKKDKEKDRE